MPEKKKARHTINEMNDAFKIITVNALGDKSFLIGSRYRNSAKGFNMTRNSTIDDIILSSFQGSYFLRKKAILSKQQ